MVITNGDVILVALNGNLKIIDNQLEAVSGGCGSHKKNVCVKCGKYDCFGWKDEFDLD